MKNVRDGYKMTELGEIPNEWAVTRLQNIAQICYGKSQKEIEVDSGKYGILGTGGIIGKTDSFLWNKPSVLIGRKGTIDKPQYIEEPFWTVDTLFYTKVNERFIAKWLYYYLNNIDLKKYNEATGVPSLSASVLNNIKIVTPPENEQQKISLILSSVDEQIENTDNLIEKTNELKKGLMQELLTKGIGHSRFKDTEIGKIPEEWEIRKLGEIFKVSSGNFLSQKNIIAGEYPVYGGNGITGYHNEYLLEESKIVIGRVGANCGCVCISENKSWITDNALFIADKINNFEDKYMFYLLTYLNLNQYANQNAQPVISGQKIYELKIALPNELEQKQISLILSSVDEQIEQYESKKEKLQELKKGLMQKLLTGSIRVKV